MIEQLMIEIEALEYRVESYGDLGAASELDSLRRRLAQLQGGTQSQPKFLLRAA